MTGLSIPCFAGEQSRESPWFLHGLSSADPWGAGFWHILRRAQGCPLGRCWVLCRNVQSQASNAGDDSGEKSPSQNLPSLSKHMQSLPLNQVSPGAEQCWLYQCFQDLPSHHSPSDENIFENLISWPFPFISQNSKQMNSPLVFIYCTAPSGLSEAVDSDFSLFHAPACRIWGDNSFGPGALSTFSSCNCLMISADAVVKPVKTLSC